MILADTSIWADHIRQSSRVLEELLEEEELLMHPFVIGELALGNLRNREERIANLSKLPSAVVASHAEAMHLLSSHALSGHGIGYVDLHLLTSAMLTDEATIWTKDRRLVACAELLGVGFTRGGSA